MTQGIESRTWIISAAKRNTNSRFSTFSVPPPQFLGEHLIISQSHISKVWKVFYKKKSFSEIIETPVFFSTFSWTTLIPIFDWQSNVFQRFSLVVFLHPWHHQLRCTESVSPERKKKTPWLKPLQNNSVRTFNQFQKMGEELPSPLLLIFFIIKKSGNILDKIQIFNLFILYVFLYVYIFMSYIIDFLDM